VLKVVVYVKTLPMVTGILAAGKQIVLNVKTVHLSFQMIKRIVLDAKEDSSEMIN
jgi:hypothetical protein